jgi:hypothetical protein
MFENLFFFYLLGNENLILHGIIRNEAIPSGVKFTFMFLLMLGHTVPNWRPTRVVKHGAKNSQMLMGTKNIVYKGNSLYVHRNNKNHILETRMVSTLIAS